jgi:hypothetical protein
VEWCHIPSSRACPDIMSSNNSIEPLSLKAGHKFYAIVLLLLQIYSLIPILQFSIVQVIPEVIVKGKNTISSN